MSSEQLSEDENNALHDFRCEQCADLVGRYTDHEPVTRDGLDFCSAACVEAFDVEVAA